MPNFEVPRGDYLTLPHTQKRVNIFTGTGMNGDLRTTK
jgi:hypothetical protein